MTHLLSEPIQKLFGILGHPSVYVWVCRRVCVLGHQRSFLYGDLRIKRKALLVSSKHFVPNKYGRPELSKF